jgi:hypothetical protein
VKSSASKESKEYCKETLREVSFDLDKDLTPNCRTVSMGGAHYYSTVMMESSTTSKSTYAGDVNDKGWLQTPLHAGRLEEFNEAEQTPTYVPDGRKSRAASV